MSMPKAPQDKDAFIYRLRHSLAHIMAQAVLQIRPKAKLGFGPPVDNGFYYDFDFGSEPISEETLTDIEQRMQAIVKERQVFSMHHWTLDESVNSLANADQHYKIEYAKELVESGAAGGNTLSFYTNGPFMDMCEGPHLVNTGEVPKACFKLDKIAGSYWRGDEKRPMLTRIYGLAFESRDELKDYIAKRELAMQRDHKKLGKELEIYMQDDEVGVGLPLWLPNGTVIRDELEKWARDVEFRGGYDRVSTPMLTRDALFLRSGHLPYYADSMYPPMACDEDETYYLRPMNCPFHHKIYGARSRSYRELPVRLAEYGTVFRYEKHGSLAGLLRVRAMCMNDAHIYCEYEHVKAEFDKVMAMYRMYYQHLRIGDFRVRLSLHDPKSEKYAGTEAEWLRSEAIVREILGANGIVFEEETGEAAFYGPKVDIQIKNVIGREETVSTCQLDFIMAERFDLHYAASDGSHKRPYIIHRAPLSTHERFISFLIEFYGGAFPTWMAPTQVCIVPVSEHVHEYGRKLQALLRENFIRAEIDDSSETFNKRIRTAVTRKIPNIWIIGNNEAADNTITWRRYCTKEQQTVSLDQALATMKQRIASREMDNFAEGA